MKPLTTPPTHRRHPLRISAAGFLAAACFWAASSAAGDDYETPVEVDKPTSVAELHPLIVNGSLSSAHPTTGALLVFEDAAAETLYGLCSGTLIGCHTFLTAAHCVCPEEVSDARGCLQAGLTDPATMRVFLQSGGVFHVSKAAISADYSFAERADFAVLTLSEDVTGIAPSPINAVGKPAHGTVGTIVGFGMTSGGFMTSNDAGVKREGAITTDACPEDIADGMNVCWEFSGNQSNVCSGDSGGPLFVDLGTGPIVAGVTSGSYSFDCEPPDNSFDSDVFAYHAWIEDTAGTALESESCGLPNAGSAAAKVVAQSGQLSGTNREATVQLEVPAGTSVLRIALNGQLGSGSGFSTSSNDFDLFVRAGESPTTAAYDCGDTNPSTFGFCEIDSPAPGAWFVLVHLNQGAGVYQLTATAFTADESGSCAGDCDGSGEVSDAEITGAVEADLGGAASTTCAKADVDGNGVITVDEVVAAVNAKRNQCGAS